MGNNFTLTKLIPFPTNDFSCINDINNGDRYSCVDDSWLEDTPLFHVRKVNYDKEDIAIMNSCELEAKHHVPERNLMAAILNMAFADSSRNVATVFSRELGDALADAKTAYKWLESDDNEYVFSFMNICRELAISPLVTRNFARKRYSKYVTEVLMKQPILEDDNE